MDAVKIGQCIRCKEWCSLTDPCCGSGIYHEGDIVYPEDMEEENGTED